MPVSLSGRVRGLRRLLRRRCAVRAAMLAGPTLVLGLTMIGTAGSAPLFADGFESGSVSRWTSVATVAGGVAEVQDSDVATGRYAVRLAGTTSSGSFAYLRRSFAGSLADLTAVGRFEVTAEGLAGSNVPLLRLFDGAGKRLLSVYRQNQANDELWLQYAGSYVRTGGRLPLHRWARLEVAITGADTSAGSIEVRLDGEVVHRNAQFGLGGTVSTIQIGNDVKAQAFAIVVDDVAVTKGRLMPPASSTPAPSTMEATAPLSTTTTAPSPPTSETTPPATLPATTVTPSTSTTGTTTVTTQAARLAQAARPPQAPTTTTTSTTPVPAPPAGAPTGAPTGVVYYLDADGGNDANAGTDPASAWKSLARASRVTLQPGDGLLLARGRSWQGRLLVSGAGTDQAPVTVSSYGEGNRPAITGGGCVEVPGSHVVISGLEVANCSWSGISVTGNANRIEGNLIRNNVAGIAIRAGASANRVLGNEIRDNNRMSVLTPAPGDDSGAFGVLLWGDDNEVAGNTISGSDAFSYDYGRDGAAVEVFGGQRNRIHHNRAFDNDAFSELGNSRAADNTFAYNVVRSSLPNSTFLVTRGARSGFGPVARTKLLNNTAVMTGRGSEGVVCDSGCGPDILTMRGNIIQAVHKVGYADHPFDEDHNLFWGGIVQFVASSSDLSADPRFVDVGHGNLHLRADSPAVDVGTETGQGADLDGARVPQDGDHNGSAVPDVGAYERHA